VIIGVTVTLAVVALVLLGVLLYVLHRKRICCFKPAGGYIDIEDPLLKSPVKEDV